MELTVVMLLHILISCSRTVAQPSGVCLASADQGTTAVLNIDNVSPVSKKYVRDGSSLGELKLGQSAHTSATNWPGTMRPVLTDADNH